MELKNRTDSQVLLLFFSHFFFQLRPEVSCFYLGLKREMLASSKCKGITQAAAVSMFAKERKSGGLKKTKNELRISCIQRISTSMFDWQGGKKEMTYRSLSASVVRLFQVVVLCRVIIAGTHNRKAFQNAQVQCEQLSVCATLREKNTSFPPFLFGGLQLLLWKAAVIGVKRRVFLFEILWCREFFIIYIKMNR